MALRAEGRCRVLFGSQSETWSSGARIRMVAALSMCLFLGWRICANFTADLFGKDHAAQALNWDPDNPETLAARARVELEDPGKNGAIAAKSFARNALLKDPLAPGALALYGLAVERLDGVGLAKPILRLAGKTMPLDLIAHGWLYEHALELNDGGGALAELDVLLRGRPGLSGDVAASLARWLDAVPRARRDLATELRRAPPWRQSLLSEIAARTTRPESLEELFGALIDAPAPLTDAEIRPFFERLMRDGDFDQAYLTFARRMNPQDLGKAGFLFNGGFRRPVSNLPFDWEILSVDGANVDVEKEERGKALKVSFFGGRVAFGHVRHMLALAPGEYKFSGWARAMALETPVGLRWRISCLDGEHARLAETAPLRGSQKKKAFQTAFSVPRDGCAFQELRLETPGRILSDLEIVGEAAYRDMTIERLTRQP